MGSGKTGRSEAGRRRAARWETCSRSELLELRLCDLGLCIEGSVLEERLDELRGELEDAGLAFRPYAWLSTDWFTPDGLTGFAIPFYLAHPRLQRLEHSQVLEVEGGTRSACLKLLRHETAHALDNAWRLRRKKRWRQVFGSPAKPYRSYYRARPSSRNYVLHLDAFYSQSHPLEDFAETFAVWLRSRRSWRRRYRDWPALRKLEYVDELMQQIAGQTPPVRTRARVDSLASLDMTLAAYYRRKRAQSDEGAARLDRALRQLFSEAPEHGGRPSAAAFLRRNRRVLCQRVASVRGDDPYVVEQVLKSAAQRCRRLGLRLTRSERQTRLDATVLLATVAARHLDRGTPLFWR